MLMKNHYKSVLYLFHAIALIYSLSFKVNSEHFSSLLFNDEKYIY